MGLVALQNGLCYFSLLLIISSIYLTTLHLISDVPLQNQLKVDGFALICSMTDSWSNRFRLIEYNITYVLVSLLPCFPV